MVLNIETAENALREAERSNQGPWVAHSKYVAWACRNIADGILPFEKTFCRRRHSLRYAPGDNRTLEKDIGDQSIFWKQNGMLDIFPFARRYREQFFLKDNSKTIFQSKNARWILIILLAFFFIFQSKFPTPSAITRAYIFILASRTFSDDSKKGCNKPQNIL